jgi:threonine 3-dehydrogenase
MKALVKEKPEPGLWSRSQLIPEIGPDDALVGSTRPASAAPTSISSTGTSGRRDDPDADDRGPRIFGPNRRTWGQCAMPRSAARVRRGPVIGMKSAARAGAIISIRDARHRRQHPGRLRRICAVPAFNIVPLPDDADDELGAILSIRQRGPHRACLRSCGGGRAHHAGADRHHGGGRRHSGARMS